jgi:hypothetical protein
MNGSCGSGPLGQQGMIFTVVQDRSCEKPPSCMRWSRCNDFMGQQITLHSIGLDQIRCLLPLPGYAPRELPDLWICYFYTSMLNTCKVPELTIELDEPHIILQPSLCGSMQLNTKELEFYIRIYVCSILQKVQVTGTHEPIKSYYVQVRITGLSTNNYHEKEVPLGSV